MCRPTNNSHVGGKNNLHIWVHEILLEGRIVRHVEEDAGQLWRSVPRPVAPEAAAVGLDEQSNSLQDLVQDLLHGIAALHLLYELEYELGLLDGGHIFVGGRLLDLDRVAEGGTDDIRLDFFLVVLLCKLGVVVEELLRRVFVSHGVRVAAIQQMQKEFSSQTSWLEEESGAAVAASWEM